MLKIVVTETGNTELSRLEVDIEPIVDQINNCFDELEKIGEEAGLSDEILHKMRSEWGNHYKSAIKKFRRI